VNLILGTAADRIYETRPDFDLISGEFYARELHTACAWMRANEPIYHDRENGLYAITRHADIMTVSKSSPVFRSGQGFRPDSGAMPMMISMDRPEHTVRRGLVNRGFTPRRVAAYEPRIREVCTQIIDRVAERGECDFVRDIAAPLPLIVIGDMLGVEEEHYDDLLRWSDDMMVGLGVSDEEKIAAQANAAMEYREYCLKVVADRRRKAPAEDLMSILVHAEFEGERLDEESLVMESLLILIGGDETTRHVISGGMQQLLLHPDQYRALAGNPSAIPVAVEEMLRWVTPIQNMMRTVAETVEVGGHEFHEGDRVLLIYPSGNRDETVFDRPFEFDTTRDPNPHLAFGGYGAHFCLGNSLARLELRVMFEELLRRIPDMRLASEAPPPIRPANFVVGIEQLPVRFTPIAREVPK
jgi:cytochrome P450 family 142 subfamily A polypeptide 1